MSNPFFLTRQTANLMEDFVRELEQGSALFLLYGETGVGKTRLLQELAQSRLAQHAVYWLDLDTQDDGEETRMDRSAEVEALFAAAGGGDIIIADHFEMALKKTRHQLFLSWSTDGMDKQLNLIIASSIDGFKELCQLSQQYGVRMQSFQLMPFSADEVRAFLGFYLFPDQPVGKLGIPSPLRRQIAAAQGVVGRLKEIADRDGGQIQSEPVAESVSVSMRRGSRVGGYVLAVLLLVAGLSWYLLRENSEVEAPPLTLNQPLEETPAVRAPIEVPLPRAEVEAEVSSTVSREEPAAAETAMSIEESAAVEAAVAESAGDTDGGDSDSTGPIGELALRTAPAAAAADPEQTLQPALQEAETMGASAPQEAPQGDPPAAVETEAAEVPASSQTEPGIVPESEAVIVAGAEPQLPGDTALAALPQTSEQRFRDELRQSMDWIRARDDSVGTIQILLLSYDNFDPENYYDYVAGLARRDVDVEQLRVFKTLTGNREVYSVVYGEYDDRRAAFGAIAGLPAVLRDTSPLPRSVGGLWQEIRRLETVN